MRIIGASIAILFAFVGTLRAEVPPDRIGNGETQEYFDKNIKPLTAGIAGSKKVVLYEGLPHQFWERDILAKEMKEKKTVRLHDFPFYAEPIALKEEDAKYLTEVYGKAETFSRYRGPKKCGGYHPDWSIEWKDGDATYRANICIGCNEIRIYGPKNDVYCDGIPGKTVEMLRGYRKNRPITKDNP